MQAATLGFVEPYQQILNFSCGAAALKAVAQHWGDDLDEPMLIDLIGIDPKSGSTAGQVADAARRLGYSAWVHQFRSTEELKHYTDRDIPVIAAIRSFTRPNQGHFVVARDVNDHLVDMMDPNVAGNERRIPRTEMARRWEFRDNVGVIVLPRQPRRRNALALGQSSSSSRGWWIALGTAAAVAATVIVVTLVRRRQA